MERTIPIQTASEKGLSSSTPFPFDLLFQTEHFCIPTNWCFIDCNFFSSSIEVQADSLFPTIDYSQIFQDLTKDEERKKWMDNIQFISLQNEMKKARSFKQFEIELNQLKKTDDFLTKNLIGIFYFFNFKF